MEGARCKGELSAGDAKSDDHGGLALLFQYLGTFVKGGPGGEDIVDEQDVPSGKGALAAGFGGEGECTLEVGKSAFAVEHGLAGGIALTAQTWDEGELCVAMEAAGDFAGLVESAVAQFSRMQRHGGDEPVLAGLDSRFFKGFEQEMAEHHSEVELAIVFKMMNEVAHETAAFITGEGEVKGCRAVLAIGANDGQAGV